MLIQKSDGGIQVTMMPPSDQKYKMTVKLKTPGKTFLKSVS